MKQLLYHVGIITASYILMGQGKPGSVFSLVQ